MEKAWRDAKDENVGIVFITGSTGGIGEACAWKFASQGAHLILNGRDTDKLNILRNALVKEWGVDVLALPFDVRNREAAKKAISELPPEWKSIAVLINNAGLVLGTDKEFEGDLNDWDTVIDTNIKGLLTVTRLVVPGMVERGKGHIINIGSIAGDAAYAGGSVYCATKSAVKALSDGLRIDLVDTPLRVSNIKPGMVETNFSITRYKGDKSKADAVYAGLKPLTGEDIAETVSFVVSTPAHVQVAEVLVMPTNQATATVTFRN
ncbi:MAG: SDR family NAD(P)-dependent oxidoreductase [Candidatus Symbiothrix sp.]|jgi:NADP-dependent 3-hydroxy acid dehydrogenase YdfG|nr:SDR family NAD(P)-dependent oxidoreductase [Candidatus Symbiothrix sp.]